MSICETSELPNAVLLSEEFCAFQLQQVEIDQARSIVAVPGHETDFLVVERGSSSVLLCQNIAFADESGGKNNTTSSGSLLSDQFQCRSLVQYQGLNHGLALSDKFLYASSSSEVILWPINVSEMLNGDLTANPILGPGVVAVNNIDVGGHSTRTLILDSTGQILYVSVGSQDNVDDNSDRSRIRWFNISEKIDSSYYPLDFQTADIFADGLRNEVGLAFDKHQVLWGVENGADNLRRDDLGDDIYNDNPGEELNRFPIDEMPRNYGFPFCWSEYLLDTSVGGLGPGTQWAWPKSFSPDNKSYTDDECRNESIFVRPELSMQAHSAPLGITFYQWENEWPIQCAQQGGAFPRYMDGYAFVAFHGSWNRAIPTGYKVVYVAMDANGRAQGEAQDFLAHEPPNARWENGFRPVDLAFDGCGRLLVSSDGTAVGGSREGSMVVRIEYQGNDTQTEPLVENPTSSPSSPTSSADCRVWTFRAFGFAWTICAMHIWISMR
ncbi:hypothetical protein ACA910_021596 [Epithemia clementina (nom. ined.)]